MPAVKIFEINLLSLWLCFETERHHASDLSKRKNYSSLKGTVARDFLLRFYHLTVPPWPIRGSLEPFLILANFHGVLKRLASVRDTGNRKKNNEVRKI